MYMKYYTHICNVYTTLCIHACKIYTLYTYTFKVYTILFIYTVNVYIPLHVHIHVYKVYKRLCIYIYIYTQCAYNIYIHSLYTCTIYTHNVYAIFYIYTPYIYLIQIYILNVYTIYLLQWPLSIYIKQHTPILLLLFSHSVMLRPHGLQHTRPPCPPPSPGACSKSCPSQKAASHLCTLSMAIPTAGRAHFEFFLFLTNSSAASEILSRCFSSRKPSLLALMTQTAFHGAGILFCLPH